MEPRWTDGPLLGFDIEGTDKDPQVSLPVSYAFALKRAGEDRVSAYQQLVDPGVEIPAGAIAIHGITTERAQAEGQPLEDAAAQVVARLMWAKDEGVPLVGMNVRYDLTVFDRVVRDCYGAGLVEMELPGFVLDLFVLDRHFDRFRRGSRTLTALCGHYRVPLEEAHDARADAVASLRCLLAMAAMEPAKEPNGPQCHNLAPWPLHDLHRLQAYWHHEQQRGLSDYFVRQGKEPIPESEDGWPIVGQNCVKQLFSEPADLDD